MKGKFSIITTAIELVCMIVMKSYSNTVGNKVRPAGSRLRELDGVPVVRLDEESYTTRPPEEVTNENNLLRGEPATNEKVRNPARRVLHKALLSLRKAVHKPRREPEGHKRLR